MRLLDLKVHLLSELLDVLDLLKLFLIYLNHARLLLCLELDLKVAYLSLHFVFADLNGLLLSEPHHDAVNLSFQIITLFLVLLAQLANLVGLLLLLLLVLLLQVGGHLVKLLVLRRLLLVRLEVESVRLRLSTNLK